MTPEWFPLGMVGTDKVKLNALDKAILSTLTLIIGLL